MNEKKQIFLAPEPEIMTIITVMGFGRGHFYYILGGAFL